MENTAFMHHLYALVDYGDATYLKKLYVEEAMNNKGTEVFSRAYTLKDIKKVAPIPNSVLSPEGGLTGGTGTTTASVSDLWSLVKQYDSEFSPREASKVVEEDSYQPKGMGTSPGTYAVYLSIKNPMDMDAPMDSKWIDLFQNPEAELDASYLDGEIVHRAIPINALENTAEQVTGTYAIVAYATDDAGREVVAVITVEQRESRVVEISAYDAAHAVSGRIKKGSQVDTKSQGFIPIKATTISIANLLDAVNNTYQSILTEDVLNHFFGNSDRDSAFSTYRNEDGL